jgi:hypothetical protein
MLLLNIIFSGVVCPRPRQMRDHYMALRSSTAFRVLEVGVRGLLSCRSLVF